MSMEMGNCEISLLILWTVLLFKRRILLRVTLKKEKGPQYQEVFRRGSEPNFRINQTLRKKGNICSKGMFARRISSSLIPEFGEKRTTRVSVGQLQFSKISFITLPSHAALVPFGPSVGHDEFRHQHPGGMRIERVHTGMVLERPLYGPHGKYITPNGRAKWRP